MALFSINWFIILGIFMYEYYRYSINKEHMLCLFLFCFDIFSVENIVPAGFDSLSDRSIVHGSAL